MTVLAFGNAAVHLFELTSIVDPIALRELGLDMTCLLFVPVSREILQSLPICL